MVHGGNLDLLKLGHIGGRVPAVPEKPLTVNLPGSLGGSPHIVQYERTTPDRYEDLDGPRVTSTSCFRAHRPTGGVAVVQAFTRPVVSEWDGNLGLGYRCRIY